MKQCIFHYPGPVDNRPGVGSALRPNRMLNAFKELGYDVFEITGYSKERKERIKIIKNKIKNGEKFDFVYSEIVNSPTAYSDEDHVPRHPFMDCNFFSYCKKENIPVGLFYRDIYWRFPIYKETVSFAKRLTLIPAFKYEISRYRKSINRLFLPTMIMQKYGLEGMDGFPLPPGGDIYPELLEQKANRTPVCDGKLKLFYVGSLSSMYDNTKLFEAVKNTENVYLTVCTHKKQWEALKDTYAPYMCDRIEIVHKSGKDLIPHYLEADISPYCLNKCDYLDLAMPIKVFETISYGTPLLVADIHSIGELVKNENIGWNTKNTAEDIANTLKFLRDNPNEIAEKTANTISIVPNHTWLARAKQAAEELTK